MKVVLTLLVRDEADIIEANLTYHLHAGVDFIIATDNGSVDGTTAMLKKYAQTGRLAYFYQAPSDFSQHAWVTHMARRAFTDYQADWVINGDADEFFVAREGGLKDALHHVPGSVNAIHVQRHDFVPFNRTGTHPPPVAMIFRKRRSLNLRAEPLPPKVIHRGVADVTISQGNHQAGGPSFPETATPFPAIEVFHYPIRSFEQFETKVRNGGSGYAVNKHLGKDIGFHKRYWYDLFLEGRLKEEYNRHFYEPERLLKALAAGDLVADRALSDVMQQQQAAA